MGGQRKDRVLSGSGTRGSAGSAVVFLLILAALLGGGAFLLWARGEYRSAQRAWEARLSALAGDRKAAVEGWLAEIHADSEILARFPTFRMLVEGGEAPPGRAPFPEAEGPRRHLEAILAEIARAKHYLGIAVVEPQGGLLAASPGTPELPEACRRWSSEGGWRDAHIRFLPGPGGRVLLVHGLLAGPPGQPSAAIFFFLDPEARLYPALSWKPLAAETGEVLLVRREGDRVRFLSPLRFSPAAPLSLTRPVGDRGLPASLAAQGEERFGAFHDYRGRPVLAATRWIARSRWGLVAKVDRAEALGEVRFRVAWAAVVLVLFLSLLGLSALAAMRRRRLLFLEALSARDERYRLLRDEAGDPLLFVRPDGVILEANRAAEEAYGFGPGEMAGLPLARIRPPDHRDDLPAQLEEALAGGIDFETVHLRKDGTQFPVEVRSRPVRLGGETLLVSAIRDISKRKESEEALRRSEARYRELAGELEEKVRQRTSELREALQRMAAVADEARLAHEQAREGAELLRLCLEGAGAGSWVWDPGAGEVRGSGAFLRQLGAGEGRMSLEAFLDCFEAGEREALLQAMEQALQGKEPLARELRGAETETRWFRLSGRSFFDERGYRRLLGLILETTAEREATETLRRQAEKIAALNRELQAANAELEAFSYSASHDLRAPLRALDGFSQALAEDFGEVLGERGKDYLLRIRSAAHRMAHLIDDLLHLSRASRADLHRTAVDLSALAEGVLEELLRREPERKVQVHLKKGLQATGDPRLLRIVLENLLGNALKYTAKKEEAHIAFRREGGAFVVEDNGAGFDMRFAGKLFTPFQRLHSAQEFPGTGVGLALVRRIVRRHGGEVWARGEPGRGAAFFFTLEIGEGHEPAVGGTGGSCCPPPPTVS